MDTILVVMALVALSIPVAIIALIVGYVRLQRRVESLEAQLLSVPSPSVVQDMPPPAVAPVAMPAPAVMAPPVVNEGPWVNPVAPQVDPVTAASIHPATGQPTTAQPTSANPAKAGFARWLVANWVYVVSAASLALAGVFFVQYGIENGLLPPRLRVLAGISFGLALVFAGEWLRRRTGDDDDSSTAFLPSVFAGAGVVSIFAAILAARQLYGLIGAETAFAGHLMAAALAVVLGWFYGPLLAAVGMLGAFAAPFIVSSTAAPGDWLFGYFTLIASVGLAIGAVRRWTWVPILALILGYGGGALFAIEGGTALGWVADLLVLAVLTVILPMLSLVPRHAGPSLLQRLVLRSGDWPILPVRFALAATLASTGFLILFADAAPTESMLALAALTALAVAYLLWAERAEGLADSAVIPTLGFWAMLLMQGLLPAQVAVQFAAPLAPEAPPLLTATLILAMGGAISLAFAIRSFRAEPLSRLHGLGAVLAAPVTVAILELTWQPGRVLGTYPWALHIMALAAAMVLLALRYARMDGEDRARAAYATLSALSLIALALFLVTTKTALTLALAVLVLVAAGLNRRFRLPEMGLFIQIAAAVLGYRLLADPGVDWALSAPIVQVVLCFGGVIAALSASLWLLRDLAQPITKGVLESAAMGFAVILANILISRLILGLGTGSLGLTDTHWGATLNAMPWLVLMLIQIYRARLGGVLRPMRQAIAMVAALLSFGGLMLAVSRFNPLFSAQPEVANWLRGPMIFDTLAIAYGVPGAVLFVAGLRLAGLGPMRRWSLGLGGVLLALYVGLEIRRFWHGPWIGGTQVTQGELYSYTVAMLLLGAGLLYQAIAKRSASLRRLAMAVIAVTVAKVFLLDASGLTGLTRVASFLGLGLSLAGLAWLNRWAGKSLEK